ncbi:hypothetical protein [Streptomyces umbrinus]|uniref:hypothetical protein n=1 Tax=Streptomyces umbrinus TaxID=67370 RepID=UPI0033FDDD50
MDEDRARQVRQAADGVQVGDDVDVPEPLLPAGQFEAVQVLHVDVGGQDVGAHLRPTLCGALDCLQEAGGIEALALELAEHVGDGEQHRGDGTAVHRSLELLEGQVSGARRWVDGVHQTMPPAIAASSAVRVGVGMS